MKTINIQSKKDTRALLATATLLRVGLLSLAASSLLYCSDASSALSSNNQNQQLTDDALQPDKKIMVKRFFIIGAEILNNDILKRVVTPFENKELDSVELEKLIANLTNVYHAKGYYSVKISIPEQKRFTRGGRLKIKVIEGSKSNAKPQELATATVATAVPIDNVKTDSAVLKNVVEKSSDDTSSGLLSYNEQIQEAQTLFNQKEYDKVASILSPLITLKNSNGLSANFLLGKIYTAKKECANAIPYYERALNISENYAPAKLELASCSYTLGDYANANRFANEALRESLPAAVKQNVIDFIELLKKHQNRSADGKNTYFGTVMVGFTFDSNPSSRTDNIPSYVNEKVKSGTNESLMINFNDIYDFGDTGAWILKSSFTLMSQAYNDKKFESLDTGFASINVAPSYKFTSSELSFPVWLNKMNYGYKMPGWNNYDYMDSKGFGVKYSTQNTPALRSSYSLKYEEKEFVRDADSDRDSKSIEASVDGAFVISDRFIADGAFSLTKEFQNHGVSLPDVAHESINAKAGLTTIFSTSLSMNTSFLFKKTNYQSVDTGNLDLNGVKRVNDSATASLGLVKKLAQNHSVILNAAYTKQMSNNAAFDFNKRIVGINYTYEFWK